ncbi:hypothetical protein QQS21_006860 [Conoideocrella luteorostrata]|uniref:Uncharacterized protein n=1 Tax=Conoideocrella luteorostrata TaxID=1105319 RepID=A0AAJ0CM87_9HYPO|nr:hypothetical protein QQS21_006860 [Conoideocrella luteorostrata]
MPATPVANREILTASGSVAMADYLRAQQPTFDKIRNGLALFAVFIIVRFFLQRIYALVSTNSQAEHRSQVIPTTQLTPSLRQPPRPASAWLLDEKFPISRGFGDMKKNKNTTTPGDKHESTGKAKLSIDPNWGSGAEARPRQFITRLPPAPPLTPPELSSAVFNIAPGQHHAIDSFMHQPNPDYMDSTTSAVSQLDSASPTAPRRRSYHRMMPLGIPTPQQSFKPDMDSATASFSPSSYPPTSPLLPPPPPGAAEPFDDGQAQQQEVDVKGEIISALDNEGAGWTRHTRVYGGGICLACAAAGGKHGGGFYGATVTPEEMRQDAYSARRNHVFVQS